MIHRLWHEFFQVCTSDWPYRFLETFPQSEHTTCISHFSLYLSSLNHTNGLSEQATQLLACYRWRRCTPVARNNAWELWCDWSGENNIVSIPNTWSRYPKPSAGEVCKKGDQEFWQSQIGSLYIPLYRWGDSGQHKVIMELLSAFVELESLSLSTHYHRRWCWELCLPLGE